MKKQTITLPKGMTANEINVCVEDGKIMVSYEVEPIEPEYKCGDVVVFCDGAMSTVIDWNGGYTICNFVDCGFLTAEKQYIQGIENRRVKGRVLCLATPEQVFQYYKAFKDAGYEWDSEKMEFVEYVWKPEKGDTYYCMYTEKSFMRNINVEKATYNVPEVDKLRFKFGNYFRTKEAAQAAADQIKEVLKNAPKE